MLTSSPSQRPCSPISRRGNMAGQAGLGDLERCLDPLFSVGGGLYPSKGQDEKAECGRTYSECVSDQCSRLGFQNFSFCARWHSTGCGKRHWFCCPSIWSCSFLMAPSP